MWKSKEVPDYREKEYPYNIEFGDGRTKDEMDKMQENLNKELVTKSKKKKKHQFTSDVIKFNKLGRVPKDHPFRDREFDGAFKKNK